MSKNNFRHTFVTDSEDVSRYLESLIHGFRSGALNFSNNHRKIRLEPADVLELTVETSARKGKVRISLHITWPEEEGPRPEPLPLDDLFVKTN
ncbi:MAG: amphi-Trp domain-containing protein [Deltaproteobacteria bacterium]|jgi:amphi-Trp domain-containing protein|nr:amphi-Trp domain-containing protein [Deltaproteobacteria bacterium]